MTLPRLMLVLVFSVAPAQAAEPYEPCKTQNNTIEMNDCMNQLFREADRELNRVYQEVLARLPTYREYMVDVKRVRELLVDAQRNWVAFRQKDCDAIYALNASGTIRGIRYFGCMKERTDQRIAELRGWDQP